MESVISIPRLAAAPLPWWLWVRVPSVLLHVCPEAWPTLGPFLLILGCSFLAPAMLELILQMRLLCTRCSFRMQDPPRCSAFTPLPGGRVTNGTTATR